MKSKLFLVFATLLAAPGAIAADCPMQHAIYTEPQAGYELRFRPAESWESYGMVKHVFEVVTTDGRFTLWGQIGENMGTSRDEGRVYFGCERPGPDDAPDDAALADCQVWENVVYALGDRSADYTPLPEEPAPDTLLLADFGRKLRYSEVVSGPGLEPWDVFTITGCAS